MKAALQRDLRQHTRDRIYKLVDDTFALYEMADLESADAAQALTDMLFGVLVTLFAASDADANEAGRYLAWCIKHKREHLEEEREK